MSFRADLAVRMRRPLVWVIAAWVTVFVVTPTASAQSDAQRFRVTIPDAIEVHSPTASAVTQSVDGTTTVFPTQTWTLATSSATGLVAAFSLPQPFRHESIADARMNVSLDLALGATTGSGQWAVPLTEITTDYQGGVDDAVGTVECDGHGRADVSVAIGFVPDEWTRSGKYTATLYVTLTGQ